MNHLEPYHKHLLLGAALGASLLLAACASTPPATDTAGAAPVTQRYAGFLSDYSKLQPSKTDPSAEVWINPAADFASYDKILLERIRVVLKDDAQRQAVDPTELKALVDYFHEALAREFGEAYPIVSEAGPGVMRVRIAITDLVPTQAEMSVVTLVVPFATIADFASGAIQGREAGSPPYLGDTGIEAEFVDSQSLQVLGQYVDEEVGKKYALDAEGVGDAISQYGKAYTTWGYAQQAFDIWAKRFREAFDQLRER